MAQPYRVVLLGNSFVGKTALITRFIENDKPANYSETIGAAFHTYTQKIKDEEINLQIWDTAGHEKYRSLGPVYYRNACAGILVYDVTNRTSFTDLNLWIRSFQDTVGFDVPIFIVGNKVDLENEVEVEVDEGQKFAQENNFKFFTTSAQTGFNVNFLFQNVAEAVLQATKNIKVEEKKTMDLKKTEDRRESGCC